MVKQIYIMLLLAMASVAFGQNHSDVLNGGIIERVKNTSGSTIYKGWIVHGDSTNADTTILAVSIAEAGCKLPTGIVYSDSIINNGYGLIITKGRALVAVINTKVNTVKPGAFRCLFVSATPGKADCILVASMTTDQHESEVGRPASILFRKNVAGDSLCWAFTNFR